MFGLFKKDTQDSTPASLTLQPTGQTLSLKKGETILTTALEAGIAFPHNCRVGGCASCKCKLVSGQVKELTDKSYLLSAEEMADNYILGCQSVPKTDVVVEVPNLAAAATLSELTKTAATITSQRALTHDIIELRLTSEKPINYIAGQYADISLPSECGQGVRSYSFAEAPEARSNPQTLVFHVRRVPGGRFTEWLHAAERVGQTVELTAPFGDFSLRPGNQPILAIAGGSGMAPLKALLEQARKDAVTRDVLYLFGARTQADLYALEEMRALTKNWLAHFQFVPVLSEEPAGSDWTGRRGLVTNHLDELLGSKLTQQQVYMCGPPAMIDAAEERLQAAGVSADNIFYDKFLDSSHAPAAAA